MGETGILNYPMYSLHIVLAHKESPFYLLYGRDARLPTEEILSQPPQRTIIDIDTYKTEVTVNLQEAWELARKNIKKAQRQQKTQYDRHTRDPTYRVGDRVFLYTPSVKSGPAYKFARPFQGPYRIVAIDNNVVDIRRVDHPSGTALRVAVSRLRHCPTEIESKEPQPGTEEIITDPKTKRSEKDEGQHQTEQSLQPMLQAEETGKTTVASQPTVWTNRLRKRNIERNIERPVVGTTILIGRGGVTPDV